MPKLTKIAPKYRKHKASGQAVVTINGRDHYLGPWRSKASIADYDRLIAEWLSRGRDLKPSSVDSITLIELLASYVTWAKTYYRESNELEHMKLAIRPLLDLTNCFFRELTYQEVDSLVLRDSPERGDVFLFANFFECSNHCNGEAKVAAEFTCLAGLNFRWLCGG